MQRLATIILLTAVIGASSPGVLAQADAEAAFEQAKTVYADGQLTQARDLLLKASQTDTRNPEVFLWLGKAEYQLGAVEKAIAAWTKTLKLAPDEPYASKMLKTLRGQLVDVDTSISLIETMLRDKLHSSVKVACSELLADKALTDAQRVKVRTLQAEMLLATRDFEGAQKVVRELLIRYPKLVNAAKTTLLLGQAKMRTSTGFKEGLALLKKVATDFKGTPAAATARYEIAIFNLGQAPVAAGAKELAAWINANGEHQMVEEALGQLVKAYLDASKQEGKPTADAELSTTDEAALGTASELFKRTVRAADALKLTKQMTGHFSSHYANNGADAAAISGCQTLLKAQLPPSSRSLALRVLGMYKKGLALKQLTAKAKAGQLVAGPLPSTLAAAVATYTTLTGEFPAEPAWRDQADLAERVRRLAATSDWPSEATEPKACYSWAVEIALPVIEADADSSAVSAAVNVVRAIVDNCAKRQGEKPAARGMALVINSGLLGVLAPTNSNWAAVVLRQVDLLNTEAVAAFNDNLSAGRAEENASLSDRQKELLANMAKLAAHQASYGPKALEKLNTHLELWVQHGHYKVAEQAYTQLAGALPKAQQIQAKLAVAKLWRQQAFTEHNRLAGAGLTVPRRLDPVLTRALELCYEFQEGLDEKDALLAEVRGLWSSIVAHYKWLEYFDTAEQAIKVKPAESVAVADAFANLQLANLKFELAGRELDMLLKQYNATEKITLTPAFQGAIEAYLKFISENPTGPLRDHAVASVFQIAMVFERHKAYDVAVGVYRDFAAFAAKVKVLSQAQPGSSSPLEQAMMAAAAALDAKARLALAKEIKDLKEQAVPTDISDEFVAAIDAYKNFIETYPKSVMVGQAIQRIMAIALEYAKANAWDVADGIYAGLIGQGPAIRRVERIEFCRGLCQLGKAMPDHAKKVLTTLTLREAPGAEGADEQRAVARVLGATGFITAYGYGGYGGGGYGGYGGGAYGYGGYGGGAYGYGGFGGGGYGGGGYGGYAGAYPRGAPGGSRPDMDRSSAATRAPATPPVQAGESQESVSDIQVSNTLVLAAIRQHEASQAARIAQLRDQLRYRPAQQGAKDKAQLVLAVKAVLSEAEITRQEKALNGAYEIFQGIRKKYPRTSIAEQSRGEIKVMIDHWRTLDQWKRAALLAKRFLEDNPSDAELPGLRLGIARDYLAWAAKPLEKKTSKQLMLSEVAQRFSRARDELSGIVTDFPAEQTLLHDAQWDIANSYLTQARVVDAFSRTLARGQYVRATTELLQVADKYYDHPKIGTIPQMLWDVSGELANRQYYDEAITVWNDLMIRYPTHSLAQEAALRIAQTYQNNLQQPLRAAEAYQEVNIARGGNDTGIQNTIYQIGVQLKDKKRWVEALHVLEMFVDSFPRHPQAGQALTTIGRIHQTNESWDEAIAAYRRVIAEFSSGDWVKEAKWSIAECIINLSQWRQALDGYTSYLRDYPGDSRKGEAERRVTVLKDLARYQGLVDEEDQRKAFDAQYQIATIVLDQLSNRVKAIIEYRKVAANWPQSHLADDALYAVGTAYLAMGEMDKAREAARAVAKQYPNSPLADDALYLVGKSYEDEANRLGAVTRASTLAQAAEVAQYEAYRQVRAARGKQRSEQDRLIQSLKKGGAQKEAELQEARFSGNVAAFDIANIDLAADRARQVVETLTAVQLANRQDKINAALRKAVTAYDQTSKVAGGDKAGDALLRMATIYNERLKDSDAAMAAWLEIVRQFSGTGVAEDASWRIAQHYESKGEYDKAVEAYKAFLRNYRRSPKASNAQFAIAESYEHLGRWVDAMDAYTNYINNFAKGPMVQKAREQINWIKAYRL